MTPERRRLVLALTLAVGLVPVLLAPADEVPARPKTETFTGKVMPLSGPLAKFGARLDPDAAKTWLALVADDGKVYPLIKDDGGRMFFKDEALLNRPMRLTGRLFPGSQLLQVLTVTSLVKGVPHEVYYWCDICLIKRFEPKDCECCGAPLERRETPVKK